MDEGQWPEEGHVKLAVLGEIGLVMPRAGALKPVSRCNRCFAAVGFSTPHIHAAFGQQIFARPCMDMRRK